MIRQVNYRCFVSCSGVVEAQGVRLGERIYYPHVDRAGVALLAIGAMVGERKSLPIGSGAGHSLPYPSVEADSAAVQ